MKKVCGIVAEYNPFHNGHRFQIARTREALGGDTAVVCVMSGNFVQRGEPAVFEKHARAAAALTSGGADLVLELPLPWALSSAEGFARGAVALLQSAGIVTHLSFGSESGDAEPLRETARLLLRPELDVLLREELKSGVSYARARQRAAERLIGKPLRTLETPNDILAVEYLKALERGGGNLIPLAILREGGAHDGGEVRNGRASASVLRRRFAEGGIPSGLLPAEAETIFRREISAGRGPVTAGALEIAALSRLRMLSPSAFAALPDAGEGLENRLYRAAAEGVSLEGIAAAAVSKRYALSRLRRMLWAAVLGITKADAAGTPPYLRVLAANPTGRGLLAEMRGRAEIPVLTKPAAVRELGETAQRVFLLEAQAADLYSLAFSDPRERRGGREWRASPVMTGI